MTFDDEYLALMPVTVSFLPKSTAARDLYGVAPRAAAVTSRARIEMETSETIALGGETRSIGGTLYTPPPAHASGPSSLPTTDWAVTVPGFGTRTILKVEPVYDEDGVHHLKVLVG